MPFCTQCGQRVEAGDRFCRKCGAAQPAASGRAVEAALSPRAASILCYVPWLGWVAALYVLASGRFRDLREVRFHAYQGLYLFVGWLIVDWVIGPWMDLMPGPDFAIDKILQLLLIVLWIFMLVQTSQGKRHALPIFGELAERSL
jgi:uncharacterized membrane protein